MLNDFGQIIFILALIGLGIFLLWFFIFKVKHLKTPDVYMVDGGVKTGKSLVTVMLAVKQYRKNLIRYYIRTGLIKFINLFRKNKLKLDEKPMLYSNMPLYNVKYNPLTLDILLRKVRIPYKSVCLIDEATLLADSMSGMTIRSAEGREQFDYVNENLTIFLKTYGHATHGGACFYNSQQVVDLHFAFKRCTSTYLFIAKNRNFPFFRLISCRELIHDESNDIVNTVQKDVDDDNKPLFILKRWYKYYDRYYLDVLTKDLPLLVDYEVSKVNRKVHIDIDEIVTLSSYKCIREYNERKLKKNAKK